MVEWYISTSSVSTYSCQFTACKFSRSIQRSCLLYQDRGILKELDQLEAEKEKLIKIKRKEQIRARINELKGEISDLKQGNDNSKSSKSGQKSIDRKDAKVSVFEVKMSSKMCFQLKKKEGKGISF